MKNKIYQALENVLFPDSSKNLLSLGVIQNITVQDDNKVALSLAVPVPYEDTAWQLKDLVRTALHKSMPELSFELECHTEIPYGKIPNDSPLARGKIKQFVAVASGKGGVGKSTVSVNLACALARAGAKVGLLDADVYGPSLPIMFGIKRAMLLTNEKRQLIPMEKYGVKLMSAGLLLGDSRKSLLWRGPMLHSLMQQFLEEVDWGELDYLVMDMPPGTGDIQMSLGQLAPISGAVIVSTPQDLAFNVAIKAADLFRALKVPVAGLIENMSYYVCPKCGDRQDIFGSHGAETMSQELQVPLLGSVPLEISIRQAGDKGTPIALLDPESLSGESFDAIARRLSLRLAELSF
ncbi:MAG: P-loop NTPase [Candidatus Bruticola sp.]